MPDTDPGEGLHFILPQTCELLAGRFWHQKNGAFLVVSNELLRDLKMNAKIVVCAILAVFSTGASAVQAAGYVEQHNQNFILRWVCDKHDSDHQLIVKKPPTTPDPTDPYASIPSPRPMKSNYLGPTPPLPAISWPSCNAYMCN